MENAIKDTNANVGRRVVNIIGRCGKEGADKQHFRRSPQYIIAIPKSQPTACKISDFRFQIRWRCPETAFGVARIAVSMWLYWTLNPLFFTPPN
jgi:hypothetical protein